MRVDPLFQAADPSRVSASLVTFEPGARTAWHTHPLGQRLVVTSGCGWVQCQGGAKREIRAGDVVVCPPAQKHWHGARIVNLAARGMLVVSVARRLGSESPLLAYCAAPSNRAGPQKGALGPLS